MGIPRSLKTWLWSLPNSQDQGGIKKEDKEGVLPELQQLRNEYETKVKRNVYRNEMYNYSDFDGAE